MENRFAQPRFRVFAAVSGSDAWIGWRVQRGQQAELQRASGILRWHANAQPISEGKLVCFKLDSSRFLDAVWALIEQHGLVIPLQITGGLIETIDVPLPDLPPEDWRNCWTRRFQKISDLRRRHSRRYKEVSPGPPPNLSENPKAVWKRQRLAKAKLEEAALLEEQRVTNLWREYEQADAAYRELVKVRKAQDPPLIPIYFMRDRSREVMELKAQALGI